MQKALQARPVVGFRRVKVSLRIDRDVVHAVELSGLPAAITERRVLVPTESKLIAAGGFVLLVLALIAALWPRLVTIPLSIVAFWLGSVLLAKSLKMRRREQDRGDHS